MSELVVTVVSNFLNAVPEQVKLWDKKVVTYLSGDKEAFERFRTGSPVVKWQIYRDVRSAGGAS